MRIIYLVLFFGMSVLSAQDQQSSIDRIEAIINDVSSMREELNSCVNALESSQKKRELASNNLLLCTRSSAQMKRELGDLTKAYKALELKYRALKQRVNTKKRIQPLQLDCAKQRKSVVVIPKDDNPFPTLQKGKHSSAFALIHFKPTVFRTNKACKVYDTPNGNVVAFWEKGRSFTALSRTQTFIKVSGYFIDKQWRSAKDESLWIKASDSKQRE